MENSLTKIDNLRQVVALTQQITLICFFYLYHHHRRLTDLFSQDIRKAEKLRRELEVRAEEAFTETTKERKAREKAENAALKAESELERLKAGSGGEIERQQTTEEGSEVARLVSELDKAEVEHSSLSLSSSSSSSSPGGALGGDVACNCSTPARGFCLGAST